MSSTAVVQGADSNSSPALTALISRYARLRPWLLRLATVPLNRLANTPRRRKWWLGMLVVCITLVSSPVFSSLAEALIDASFALLTNQPSPAFQRIRILFYRSYRFCGASLLQQYDKSRRLRESRRRCHCWSTYVLSIRREGTMRKLCWKNRAAFQRVLFFAAARPAAHPWGTTSPQLLSVLVFPRTTTTTPGTTKCWYPAYSTCGRIVRRRFAWWKGPRRRRRAIREYSSSR